MSAGVWIDGLFSGALYALVALALAIVFQPTRVMNFAQGETLVLGAAVGYQVVTLTGWGWPAAFAITVLVGIAAGLAQERMIMLPVKLSGSRYAWIVATLATAMIFQSLFTLRYWDVDALRPAPVVEGGFTVLGAMVGWQQLGAIVIAVAVMAGYDAFLHRTAYGRAVRAVSHSRDTAVIMGIPVQRIVVLSFAMAAVICAVAGLLAAPVLFIGPAGGLVFTIKGFTAAVIGGVGSPRGALAGGLVVGLLDAVVRNLVSPTAGNFVGFVLLGLILVLFPAGLFGKRREAH
ncbi:amino acid/amide ABC transporter membrane protein 1 (HAAT family) [Actinocorallia herbida]|uniref:Amino acid/amide ABC transporter membrane protein 1 (HAAT family) n=1 Tax=Actinocorallia herbida TaxID=58109 RepID=A0A3N1CVB7_9ACTN|nr:branched-chain amino acid ABC transporter permease [Actinocorallia herbida]ROO85241.1 amino acid/amide ABC transporter membrane protein 1 (HAAT family) [Actinocorallia herbida]